MDTLHTGAQAIWDLRRIVWWLRESEDAPTVGALVQDQATFSARVRCS
jgi:hypothetical protein